MIANVLGPSTTVVLALAVAAVPVKVRRAKAVISRLLLIGTVATAFLAAVQWTPRGPLLRTWLLD
jgi:hypothetical protein